MNGDPLSIDQMEELSRLPARDVLHGQLVGMIASPITGLVRGLNALISGLAIQLGQIRDQGLVGGDAATEEPAAEAEAPAEEAATEEPAAEAEDAPSEEPAEAEAPAEEAAAAEEDSPEPEAVAEGDGSETDVTDAPSEGDEKE
jgi:large subunit ribosomal protein L10